MALVLKRLIQVVSLLLGLAVIACTSKPEPQPSCNFVENSYEQRVSWKDATPVSLYVHSSFPTAYLPTLKAAMGQWEKNIGRPLFRLAGTNSDDGIPKKDGVSVIYWMDTWEADRPREQARTTIFWEGNRILEADLRVNAKNFTYFTGDTPQTDSVDLESLLIHELGHVLGLQHNTAAGSVMAVSLDNGVLRRDVQEVDLSSAHCEY